MSLRVEPRGFATPPIEIDGLDRRLELRLDVESMSARLDLGGEDLASHPLGEGLPAADLGARWVAYLDRLGVTVAEEAGWSGERAAIDRHEATDLVEGFCYVRLRFETFRDRIRGERGPVQLWPHHFDLSFEWLGRELEDGEGEGEEGGRAQIGFGFSTGDEGHAAPYFYANPWPFDDALLSRRLPGAASWRTGNWKGSLLPYEAARRDPPLLARYLESVYELASRGLR